MNTRQIWLTMWAVLFGVLIAMPKAHAGVGRERATGQAIWDAAVSGRSTTIGTSGGAMYVIGPAGGATAGAAAGAAKIVGSGTVPVADKKVPGVGITGEIAKDAIIGGVMGCASGTIAGCVLGAGVPLALAYMSLSGARWSPSGGGWELQDPEQCTVGPCYKWKTAVVPDEFNTKSGACDAIRSGFYPTGSTSVIPPGGSYVYGACRIDRDGQWVGTWGFQRGAETAPVSPTWYPSTPQAVKDALYNNNPPPGIVDELARYGNIIWPLGNPPSVTLTGPSEITGPKKTTTNPDGSKSVSQERTPLSYSGPTVTAGQTVKETTTYAPDGTPTGTTTETTEPGTEASEESGPEEGTPTDTAMPEVPDFYTPKFPDGMTGVWNTRKAELMASPLLQLKDQLLPSGIGSTGSCPTMPINFTFGPWADFGTKDVAPPCWVWDFGKVVVILSAMFLARALIFGG